MTTTSVELYTDGACSQNPGPGGWAFVIILKHSDGSSGAEILRGSGSDKATTNNRMELLAVIKALTAYSEIIMPKYGSCPVSLHTDSQYVQQGISSWIKKWKLNGWKAASKQPVKNQDLWQPLDLLAEEIQPDWVWVKGHAGNPYNELCDALAVEAVRKIR